MVFDDVRGYAWPASAVSDVVHRGVCVCCGREMIVFTRGILVFPWVEPTSIPLVETSTIGECVLSSEDFEGM